MKRKHIYNLFIIVLIFIILVELAFAKGGEGHGDGEGHESEGSASGHFNPGINEGNVKNESTQIKNYIYTYLILFELVLNLIS